MFGKQDLGGQTSIRPYWRCYYANTAAVIFVVDSTDIERLNTASDELAAMLNEEELRDAALLVFANKQDQPESKGAGEISEALNLAELRDRNWSIVACSAVDGSGVNEGMDWLVVSGSAAVEGTVKGSLLMNRRDSKRCSRSRDIYIYTISIQIFLAHLVRAQKNESHINRTFLLELLPSTRHDIRDNRAGPLLSFEIINAEH